MGYCSGSLMPVKVLDGIGSDHGCLLKSWSRAAATPNSHASAASGHPSRILWSCSCSDLCCKHFSMNNFGHKAKNFRCKKFENGAVVMRQSSSLTNYSLSAISQEFPRVFSFSSMLLFGVKGHKFYTNTISKNPVNNMLGFKKHLRKHAGNGFITAKHSTKYEENSATGSRSYSSDRAAQSISSSSNVSKSLDEKVSLMAEAVHTSCLMESDDSCALQQRKVIDSCGGKNLDRIPFSSNITAVKKPQPQIGCSQNNVSEGDKKRIFSALWPQVKKPFSNGFKNVGEVWEKDKKSIRMWFKEVGKEGHITKTFDKDKKCLVDGIKLFKKSFGSTLAKAFSLEIFEDSSAVPKQPQTWPRPFYPGLSGKALVAADASTIMAYLVYIRDWFAVWRVPLQNRYDPELLASYFNRRPHVLLFRIVQVCAAFGSMFLSLNLDKLFTSARVGVEEDDKYKIEVAKRIKEVVLKLGPTFVKVAQSLSTRPDLIGPDTAKVLAELQDRMPPFSNQEAMEILEKELGFSMMDIFESLSSNPVAAASLGQVYKGQTKDGQVVAVKIQRPEVLYMLSCDIYLIRLGLALVRKLAKINHDPSIFADEIGRAIYGELDYTLEASNARKFAEALSAKLEFIIVPRPILHLTTRRVLTTEWIDGVRPLELQRIAKGKDGGCSTLEQQHAARECLLTMVNKGVQSSLTQLLDVGVLHGDPHPGNILYTSNRKIGYLDFGLMCHIERKHQYAMIAAVAHLVNGEWGFLTDDLLDMDVLKPTTDWFGVRMALEDAFSGSVTKNALPDFRFSQMAGQLFKIALKFRFRLPPYYTLVLRSIASLEGMALAVDPNFKVIARTYPFVLKLLLHDNSPSMRRVLHSLLLNSNQEFRWDRISAFVAIISSNSFSTIATGTLDSSSQTLLPSVWKILNSGSGKAIRRIFFEADTRSLAEAFTSQSSTSFRQKATELLADKIFQFGQKLLNQHIELQSIRDNIETPKTETMSMFHLDRVLKLNRCLQFLLRTMIGRLQTTPMLLIRVAWTSLSIFCTALMFSSHRMCVLLSDIYCEPVYPAKRVNAINLSFT